MLPDPYRCRCRWHNPQFPVAQPGDAGAGIHHHLRTPEMGCSRGIMTLTKGINPRPYCLVEVMARKSSPIPYFRSSTPACHPIHHPQRQVWPERQPPRTQRRRFRNNFFSLSLFLRGICTLPRTDRQGCLWKENQFAKTS